jgi:hypothetical protein
LGSKGWEVVVMEEFDYWKVQALVRDLFALLSHAEWKSPEEAESAGRWLESLKAKARSYGVVIVEDVIGAEDVRAASEEEPNA